MHTHTATCVVSDNSHAGDSVRKESDGQRKREEDGHARWKKKPPVKETGLQIIVYTLPPLSYLALSTRKRPPENRTKNKTKTRGIKPHTFLSPMEIVMSVMTMLAVM